MFLVSLYFSLSSIGPSCSHRAMEVMFFQARTAVVLNPGSRELLLLSDLRAAFVLSSSWAG